MRAFGGRQILSELVGLAYSVLIARLLMPYDFGVFSICSTALALLSLAGNAGLAAPIIRQNEVPGYRLLRSLFTAYLVLAVFVCGMVWLIAPLLPRLYTELEPGHIWLIRMMAIGILIQPIGGVSYALLERELRFREIANVEFAETLAFNLVALVLASLGLGVWALAGATLVRPVIASVGYCHLKPWPARFLIDRTELRKVLHISLAIQASAIAASLRDQLFPVIVGTICGPTALGFLTWAKSSAMKPLIAAGAFDRVALPWYASTHRESGNIRPVVLVSITMLASVLYPVAGMMLAIARPAIFYIYGPKWLPAVPAFHILSLAILMAPLRGPLQSAIDSQAKAAVLYKCALVSLLVQWVVGIGGTLAWGIVGAAWAVPAQLAAISTYCYLQTRKDLQINVLSLLVRPSIHAVLAGVATYCLCLTLAGSFAGFSLATLLSLAATAVLAPIVQPEATGKWLRFARESFAGRGRGAGLQPAPDSN